jgi:hypothetical protein
MCTSVAAKVDRYPGEESSRRVYWHLHGPLDATAMSSVHMVLQGVNRQLCSIDADLEHRS